VDEDTAPSEEEREALKRLRKMHHFLEGQLVIVKPNGRNLWGRFLECREEGLPGIPRAELLYYLRDAASQIDRMNTHHKLQHLDIKPQNILLNAGLITVANFGLAEVLEGYRATVTGGVTPVYASPETFEGWISRYSDQYSLAIVFQELLTGQRPFNGENTRQLLMQHLNGTPNLSPLPECDRPIVGRALSKKPKHRFPSCRAFVEALPWTPPEM
jgi:serine/threonine protein kinase